MAEIVKSEDSPLYGKGEHVTAKVTFTLRSAVPCTREQMLEWISYRLGMRDAISESNPLRDEQLNLNYSTTLIHTV